MKWKIKQIQTCPSTNALLKQEVAAGRAAVGDVLVAAEQTRGRGRCGRSWVAAPGNLSFSVVVPAPTDAATTYQLNLVAALSLVTTIRSLLNLNVWFKWPNDVIFRDLKLAGMLSESLLDRKAAIVGIGVNLNSLPDDFPTELRPTLTTLRYETAKTINEGLFLNKFLDTFSRDVPKFLKQGLAAFQTRLYTRLAWKNRDVNIDEGGGKKYRAKIMHVDDDGLLIVVTRAGAIRKVVAGDVRCF